MTCLWCDTPLPFGEFYCNRACAKAAATDLGLWATETDPWLSDPIRYWLDQDAMLDAMNDRMMENAL